MPAYFDSGLFVKKPAWHRQGNVLDTYCTSWEEARRQAGLTWEVETEPLYAQVGDGLFAQYAPVEGYKLLTRSDTGASLSVAKDSYAVIGNGELGGIIDFIMSPDLEVEIPTPKYDALVSIKGGRIIVASIVLDEPFKVDGDASDHYAFLLVCSRHDGQGGLKIGPSMWRAECANMWGAAEAAMDRAGLGFTIRHTSTWADRLHEARNVIQASIGSMDHMKKQANELAGRYLAESHVAAFLDRWSYTAISTDMTDQVRKARESRREHFRMLLEAETNACIDQTFWKLLQTAYEYVDHGMAVRSEENRAVRQLVTTPAEKYQALAVLTHM